MLSRSNLDVEVICSKFVRHFTLLVAVNVYGQLRPSTRGTLPGAKSKSGRFFLCRLFIRTTFLSTRCDFGSANTARRVKSIDLSGRDVSEEMNCCVERLGVRRLKSLGRVAICLEFAPLPKPCPAKWIPAQVGCMNMTKLDMAVLV